MYFGNFGFGMEIDFEIVDSFFYVEGEDYLVFFIFFLFFFLPFWFG
jgi:hypothetical protein